MLLLLLLLLADNVYKDPYSQPASSLERETTHSGTAIPKVDSTLR